MTGRLVIDDLRPRTPSAGHFAKAVVGEVVRVTAVVFKEGHDRLDGRVRLVAQGARGASGSSKLPHGFCPHGHDCTVTDGIGASRAARVATPTGES